MFGQSLNINSEGLMLSDFKTLFDCSSFVYRNEKVLNFFVINFKHWDIDLVLFILLVIFADTIEDFFARNRNDTLNKIVITLLAP